MPGVGAFDTYGFINKSGRLVIPASFGAPFQMMGLLDNMCFDGGQVQVKKGSETVYIDAKGATVPPSLKHRLFELYADSHDGFKKSLSTTLLERDAAHNLDYYAVNAPPFPPVHPASLKLLRYPATERCMS